MAGALHGLATDGYDFVLDGRIIGSVVRGVRVGDDNIWHAALLDDPAPGKRPAPFSRIDHTFGSLQAVAAWLGGTKISNGPRTA